MTSKNVLLLRIAPIELLQVSHPVHCFPSLSLKYSESILLKNNFLNIKLIDNKVDCLEAEELIQKVYIYNPYVLVLFANFGSPKFIKDFCRELKKRLRDLFIIVVGPVATCNKSYLLSEDLDVDVVIRGEPEEEVLKLITGFTSKVESRERYRQKFRDIDTVFYVENLNNLPFFEISKSDMHKYPLIYPVRLNRKVFSAYMETSRGCTHSCIFCSQYVRKSYDNMIRLKSPERVVDEMEYYIKNGANFISFEDDDFTSSRNHVIDICREIRRRSIKIKWMAEARIDEVDRELLEDMRLSGCELLQFGIESGSERIIRVLNKTRNPESWIKTGKKVFAMARELGISTCSLFIVGSPGETEDDIQKSIDLAVLLRPDLIKIHFFCPYPGSKAREIFAEQLKRSKANNSQNMYHYSIPLVNFSDIPLVRLVELRNKFYKKILFNPRSLFNHLRKYFFYYVNNFRIFKFLISKTFGLILKK